MKNIKNELQDIITGDGKTSENCLIKRLQVYLGGNEIPGHQNQQVQRLQSEETRSLIEFIEINGFFYEDSIEDFNLIGEGAEQRVYRLNDESLIKLNDRIFYEFWRDYLNSLLIHNYFFKSTCYELLGFKLIDEKLFAVVKQKFIRSTESVNLELVREFLEFNDFSNIRNNDYRNETLGLIFEDLHDENIISQDGILFFIDTIFYITDNFYK